MARNTQSLCIYLLLLSFIVMLWAYLLPQPLLVYIVSFVIQKNVSLL